jgi:SAM-dependent methyltransferase
VDGDAGRQYNCRPNQTRWEAAAAAVCSFLPRSNDKMSGLPAPEFDKPLQACPLCSSAAILPYDRDFRGITISRCRGCGVKFMNPQYTDAYLSAFYSQYIAADSGFGPGPEYAAMESRRRVENFAAIERYVPAGKLFCIGCGEGLELQVARQRGWTVEGYDVDPATTARLAAELKVPIYSGDLCRLGLPGGSYDCVYLDQVLEHPKQPRECLHEAHRLLRVGGVLFLGCPNIMSLSSSLKMLLERVGIRRRNRGRYYDTQHHLFYFSPGVLRRLLERYYGFKVLFVEGDPLSRTKEEPRGPYVRLARRMPCLGSTFQLLAQK